jgi:hypothetical protein
MTNQIENPEDKEELFDEVRANPSVSSEQTPWTSSLRRRNRGGSTSGWRLISPAKQAWAHLRV